MPVYNVKKNGRVVRGKYLVRIWHQGEPRTFTVQGTRKQAERYEAEKRAELRAQSSTAHRTAPTFLSYSTGDYKADARRRLAPGTWRNRKYQIALLSEHFGHLPIDSITTAHVQDYQDARMDAGIEAVKINDDLKVFGRILRHAIARGVPATLPKWERLKERRTKGRVKVWTGEQVAALFASLEIEARGELPEPAERANARRQRRRRPQRDMPSLVPIVAVMLNCGLRKGEALALEWKAIDVRRGILRIWPNEEWQPKDNEPREVPFGAAVRPWLVVRQDKRRSPRWVFPSSRRGEDGELERYRTWPQRRFDAARDHAKVGGSPHVCRHTYASHFLAACPDLFLLAKVLGHSHSRVTAIYSHLLPDHLERARDAVSFTPKMTVIPGEKA